MINKNQLVEELNSLQKQYTTNEISSRKHTDEIKNWVAEVGAILKQLDESDYKTFSRLSNSLYPQDNWAPLFGRDPAEDIDQFLRNKVAEYQRYDFSDSGNISSNKRKGIFIPYPSIKIPKWLKEHIVSLIIGLLVTVIGGLILYYLWGIGG